MKDSLRIAPHFIEPKTILDLTEAEQVGLIEGIRARRMQAASQYLIIQEEKKKIKQEGMSIKFDRVANKIARHVEKIDAELAKVEEQFTKLRALRLEAFDII